MKVTSLARWMAIQRSKRRTVRTDSAPISNTTGLLLDPDFLDREIIIVDDQSETSTSTEPEPVETVPEDLPVSNDVVEIVESAPEVSFDQIVRIERLISAIREDGHQAADIDPSKDASKNR